MTNFYDAATVIVTAAMLGNELAIAAFVHPQLYRLEERMHAAAAAPLARVLGSVMPFWYALGLVMIAGAAYEHRPVTSGAGALIGIAAAIWAFSILMTILLLVPINNRIARMNPAQPYPRWLEDRSRWDGLHRVRVVLLLAAVVLLTLGVLGGF